MRKGTAPLPYRCVSTCTTSRTAASEAFIIFFSAGVEPELHDLLRAARPELDRDAHVEVADSVFALQVGGARQHPLLVETDRVDHLRRGCAWRVPGGRAEQLHELAAATFVRSTIRLIFALRDELVEGMPPTVVAETTGTI